MTRHPLTLDKNTLISDVHGHATIVCMLVRMRMHVCTAEHCKTLASFQRTFLTVWCDFQRHFHSETAVHNHSVLPFTDLWMITLFGLIEQIFKCYSSWTWWQCILLPQCVCWFKTEIWARIHRLVSVCDVCINTYMQDIYQDTTKKAQIIVTCPK